MKKRIAIIFCAALLPFIHAAEWKCNEGSGRILRDSGAEGLNLMIRTPEKVIWSRDGGNAPFLTVDGGVISRPMGPGLHFPDGMVIHVRFAADLAKAAGPWMPLVTSQNYEKGASVWLKNDGGLLVAFPGASNWYKLLPAKIESGKDHDLKIVRGQERVQVVLDGKVIADYASKGKVREPGKNDHFYLGSLGVRTFSGKIYFCAVKPFSPDAFVGEKVPAQVSGAEWKCKDGTGSRLVKDSGPNGLDLTIRTPDKVDWAREDDRGFFLSFGGGTVSRPMDPRLHFPDGQVIRIHFSADMKKAPTEWLPLLTVQNYDKGWSVWVRKTGQLMVTFPGTTNWYNLLPAGIQDRRDYELKIVRGRERLQIVLNGRLIADYASKGKVKAPEKGAVLYLGSVGARAFFGNIYACSVAPFRPQDRFSAQKSGPAKQLYPGDEIKPQPHVKDPAGTVVLADFGKFSPRPRVIDKYAPLYGWNWRKCPFFLPQSPGALFSPADPNDVDILSYDPGLKGNYDVYLGLRVTSHPTDMIVAVPDRETRYRVEIGRAGYDFHPNTEVLIARNVPMEKGSISFFPGSLMFLGYVKLIPSDTPRKADYPRWKCVSVTRTKGSCLDRNDEEIRQALASGRLKERFFVGPAETKNITADSKKRGYVLFPQDWMDLCFEHIAPAVDPGRFTLKVKAAKGEFEPVTFGVHGLEDCGKIRLTGGETLKKAGITVDIATILSIPKRTTNYTRASEFVVGPSCLERTDTAELKKGRTKQFWITLKVPENIKEGVYRDAFRLTSAKGEESVPIELEVRPFALDSIGRNRTALFCMRTIFDGKFSYEDVIREMADHGLNALIIVEQLYDLMPCRYDAQGKVEVDPRDPKALKLVRVMKECGIKSVYLVTRPLVEDTYGKKHGEENFVKVVTSLMKMLEENRGPEVYFYGMDEVLSNMSDRYKQALWEAKLLKKCGAKLFHTHLWYKTARPYQKELDALSPYVDVFCNRFNTRNLWYVDSWQEMQDEAARRGKEMWSYNADNAVQFSQTAMKRFAYGWFFRTVGNKTRGQSIWEYHHIYGNPYTDLDCDHTDWEYVYPANRVHKGGFSLDYEATREGVDDLRYICTLENRISEAKKKGISTASAEKLLSDLGKSFDFGENFRKKSPFLTSSFEKNWEENGRRFCGGKFNLPNGWSFADYHAAREKIASEIVRLKP